MPTSPSLDFATLSAPIDGENAAGPPVPYETKERLEEMRKEIDPQTFPADDPMRPEQPKWADWNGIIELCKETLTTTSKDLLIAARLTEALTKVYGFGGLRDGLHLGLVLITECWDRLNPPIEDGDMDMRATPFNWLDVADRGARFPNSIRTVPLIKGPAGDFSLQDRKLILEGRGPLPKEDFEKAVSQSSYEDCKNALEDLDEGLQTLTKLAQGLTEKMGGSAPGLTSMRPAMEECRFVLNQIVQRLAANSGGDGAPAGAAEESKAGDGKLTAGGRQVASRAEAYRQIAQAAGVLKGLEPHSPIPYLIQRAVELGALSFPELIRALIRDANVLTELNRELGIKPPE